DASDGVSPTEVVHASIMSVMDDDSRKRALEFLNAAAVSGSIYALETMGSIYSPGMLDKPIKSEAYYEAAEMLGHWNLAYRVTPPLPTDDRVLAAPLAQQILNNIERDRRNRGLPPLQRTVRPGLNERLLEIQLVP